MMLPENGQKKYGIRRVETYMIVVAAKVSFRQLDLAVDCSDCSDRSAETIFCSLAKPSEHAYV